MKSDALFSDLLVIDCASFVAGPAAATILADYGARVIKVEPPGIGDGYRQLQHLPGMPRGGGNYPWKVTNRNKESLALDLKQPQGRAVLDRLLEKADVFITNYPLGVRDRLKINYDDIRAVNPRAIYASLTPYGESGPEAGHTGYDATAWWARSGLMDSIRATKDSPPAMSVPGMGDHMSANTLYGAIATALYKRERTGQGSAVGTSLMANGLWSNALYVQGALDGADLSVRMSSENLSAFTQIYRCRDDRWFMLTLLPQVQEVMWPELARCLGHSEWAEDGRFLDIAMRKKNNAVLTDLLRGAFEQQDWSSWRDLFEKRGITCGRIAKSADHGEDEQALAAGMITNFDDGSGSRTVDSPLYVSGEKKCIPRRAPEVGEHSLGILQEFGWDEGAAADLCAAGIVGAPE
ncbi:MAG: crotonobetainyl-CoA:carnitine CoA-transferase CaiB-like acyl-CoA transferase [Halioglobus sp.]|jgi:crotonobetainyl-CoA:carnitine CoA-transferase CaiB-like acyl-CoA transferase